MWVSNCMELIGIIWSPAHNLFRDIIKEIQNYTTITEQSIYDLKTQVREFVYSVYGNKKNNLLESKIISIEQCESHKICVVNIQISDKLVWNKQKEYFYSLNALQLKKHIREKYSTQIDSYVFDNLFHLALNENESQFVIHAINMFKLTPYNII